MSHSYPPQSLWMRSWENWQKLAEGKNSSHSQLCQVSVIPVERKVKTSCLFLSKYRWQEKNICKNISSWIVTLENLVWAPIDYWSFPYQGQLLLSTLSLFVFWELGLAFCLPGKADVWVGICRQPVVRLRIRWLPPIHTSILPTVTSSRVVWVCLWWGSGAQETCVFCILFGTVSCAHS